MAVAEVAQARRGSGATALVGLLAAAIFINYIDRGNLATAAPLIKDEFRLSNFQIGVMTSAFFWIYTPSQLLAAWLADRLNPYRALALGFAIWSAATALTGFVGGFVAFLTLRFVLGLGESAAFPCMSKLLARHVPPSALGFANGFVVAGVSFGPAAGTLLGGLLIVHFGWRAMFVIFGLAALLWLWPWLANAKSMPIEIHAHEKAPLPSFFKLLSLRSMWGAMIGHFASNYVRYFILSWLPLYLVKERGFSIVQMSELGAMVYCLAGTSAIVSGWLADRWIGSGASINTVRKAGCVIPHIVVALCFAGVAVGSQTVVIACLFVFGLVSGSTSNALWSIAQTLAGPAVAARWTGLQNAFGNCAGIAAPLITGFVVDRTGSFADAFLVAGAVSLVGAMAWGLIVRRVEPVQWEDA
jgi:MFS family permease